MPPPPPLTPFNEYQGAGEMKENSVNLFWAILQGSLQSFFKYPFPIHTI